MSKELEIPPDVKKLIDDLIDFYKGNDAQERCKTLLEQINAAISNCSALDPLIHSVKQRIKSAASLRLKLERKAREAIGKGETLDISRETFFQRINDCVGFRILHLHTQQVEAIGREIKSLLDDQMYPILEGPIANVWDDDSATYFEDLGYEISRRPDSMYTSVHYVITWNAKKECTCELQVRTLSEELWGEVSHAVKYPKNQTSDECRDLLKVLARLSSGVTRLVDVIFAEHAKHSSAIQPIVASIKESAETIAPVEAVAIDGSQPLTSVSKPKQKEMGRTFQASSEPGPQTEATVNGPSKSNVRKKKVAKKNPVKRRSTK